MEFINGSSVALANPINLTCGNLTSTGVNCATVTCNNITSSLSSINLNNKNFTSGGQLSITGTVLTNGALPNYTPSLLNVYESKVVTKNLSNTGARTGTITLRLSRIGAVVTITCDKLDNASTTQNASIQLDAASIPIIFRPVSAQPLGFLININDSGVLKSGLMYIYADGGIQIFADDSGATFSSGGGNTCGFNGWSVNFSVQE